MPRTWMVGVISDTHGLVRPEALAALAGADGLFVQKPEQALESGQLVTYYPFA